MDDTNGFGLNDGLTNDGGVLVGAVAPLNGGAEVALVDALEAAMGTVDLRLLSEEEVADLESGEVSRIEHALQAAKRGAGEEMRMPGRISLRSIENREEKQGLIEATRMLRDGEAGSLKEALSKVFDFKGEVAAPVVVSEPNQVSDYAVASASVEACQSRLDALIKEREGCVSSYDYERSDTLLAEIVEARMELRDARKSAEVGTAHVDGFVKAEDASRERAMAQYGAMLTHEDSVFNRLLESEIALAESQNDVTLNSPEWPEKIAHRTFQKYGALLGGGAADPEQDFWMERTPPAPRAGVRKPGSPVGGGANSMALTASAALSEFDKLAPEEQAMVLNQLDKQRL